ncbi:MAG: right-handed parallel beta-helix repeat-containing protein [Thermodesulfovibrionales bacterium]
MEEKRKVKVSLCLVVFWIIMGLFAAVNAWAASSVNTLAIYNPQVDGMLSVSEQEGCADYIFGNVFVPGNSKEKFYGYSSSTVDSLISWMNAHMADGISDVLVIVDICPYGIFHGEADDSLAERWVKNGNMIIWTGSEPFGTYVDTGGRKLTDGAGAEGAGKILDVSSSGLCSGGGLQVPTTAVRDYVHPDNPTFDGQYNNGDYGISAFVPYEAQYALKYDRLLIDAASSDWNHMSYWRPEEVFAEDGENYQSDNIVLVNTDNGRFGQFYCLPGNNDSRKQVITQVLNNWANLPSRTLVVSKTPGSGEFSTIQAALNAADRRDTVLVKEGTYYEQIRIPKRGIKVVSDSGSGGNDLIPYENFSLPPETVTDLNGNVKTALALHRDSRAEDYGMTSKIVLCRAARTIIDGLYSPDEDREHGIITAPMVDFPKGSTIGTLLDGFTIQRMPLVNHQTPGHSHVIQTRGGSGTMINNIVRCNGSSGLGSHAQVWGEDPANPDHSNLDFRYTNIKYDAHPVLINNVVHNNEGNNLGNNHYSYAIMYNNECFESISVHGHESPGIGCQHGAHPLIVKNLVYKSSWVGIGSRKGAQAGRYPVNRPSHPVVKGNWVFDSGMNDSSGTEDSQTWETQYNPPYGLPYPYAGEHGAGIGADDTGGYDPKTGQIQYHIIEGNYVDGARNAGIGCRSSNPAYHDLPPDIQPGEYPEDLGFVKVIDNTVTRGGMLAGAPEGNGWDRAAGIGINGANAVEISGNTSYGNKDGGIGIRGAGHCDMIAYNECYDNGAAGIGMCEGSSVTTISNNDLHHNGAAGIGHNGSGGRVRVTLEADNRITGNGAAGIGIVASDITEIRGRKDPADPDVQNNGAPGITVISGSTVGTIADMILDHNGIANGTTGMSVLNGSSAVIKDSTITYSGKPCISIFDPGTMVTIENCTLDHSGQSGGAPVLTVQRGATAMVTGTSISYSSGAPNITVFDNASLTMFGCNVSHSGTPGIEAADSVIIIQNSVFEASGTRNIMAQRCDVTLKRVIVRDCGIGGGASFDSCVGSVKECEMYNNWPYELQLVNSTMNVERNVFHNHTNINPTIDLENSSHANLYHNTISNLYNGEPQGTTGIRVDYSSSADVRNNIIYRCKTGIAGNPATITASTNNYYVVADGILGSNVLWANPLLLEDYSLEPYSLCINAGEPIAGINDEFSGSGPDIGAKEYPGAMENLSWKTPSLTVDAREGSYYTAQSLRDDNLSTGMSWGSPWVVYDVGGKKGKRLKIYGFRFYTGSSPSDWKIYASDGFAGPWTLLSGAFPIKIGLDGAGKWDERWSNIVVPGRYVKIEKAYGPSPANSVYEFDILVSDLTVDADIIVLDNGSATVSKGWTRYTNGGYGGDHLAAPAGTGTVTAYWTPSIPANGDYDVYVRWTADANRATNVPYTVNYDGGYQTFALNQQLAGSQWIYLGTFPFVQGTSGNVMVSNSANGYVCADAVMFIQR